MAKGLISKLALLLMFFALASTSVITPKLLNNEKNVIIKPPIVQDEVHENIQDEEEFSDDELDFDEGKFNLAAEKEILQSNEALASTLNSRVSLQNQQCTTAFPTFNLDATSLVRISSPNFPRRYLRNNNCGWNFKAISGYRMRAYCNIIKIQWNNFLKMTDSDRNQATWYHWYRKKTIVHDFYGQNYQIAFTTDGRRTAPGFRCMVFLVKSTMTKTLVDQKNVIIKPPIVRDNQKDVVIKPPIVVQGDIQKDSQNEEDASENRTDFNEEEFYSSFKNEISQSNNDLANTLNSRIVFQNQKATTWYFTFLPRLRPTTRRPRPTPPPRPRQTTRHPRPRQTTRHPRPRQTTRHPRPTPPPRPRQTTRHPQPTPPPRPPIVVQSGIQKDFQNKEDASENQTGFNEEEFYSSFKNEISQSNNDLANTLNSRIVFQNQQCTTAFPTFNLDATSLVRISSPNFPRRYLRNNNCGWNFKAVSGYRMQAYCYLAQIRWYNFLKFRDVNNNNATWYHWYYRQVIVYDFWGSSSRITFTTDGKTPGDGFVCMVYLVPTSTTGTTVSTTAATTAATTTAATTAATTTAATTTTTTSSNTCRCGRKKANRIVGGGEATDNEFPWMVSLKSGRSNFCGGVLISCDAVLTAAHCVRGMSASQLSVDIGLHSQLDSSGTFVNKQVTQIIMHPSYNRRTQDYDIAIIKIGCIDFTDQAIPVCLPPSTTETYVGKNTVAAGWGTLSEGASSTPNILQKVTLPIISDFACRGFYPGDITARMICAGFQAGGKDSCQGDSGGPLMYTNGGITDVVGITSWGNGCARPNFPGVYARVTSMLDWIKSNSGLNNGNKCPRS